MERRGNEKERRGVSRFWSRCKQQWTAVGQTVVFTLEEFIHQSLGIHSVIVVLSIQISNECTMEGILSPVQRLG